jgi:hypothetical protein
VYVGICRVYVYRYADWRYWVAYRINVLCIRTVSKFVCARVLGIFLSRSYGIYMTYMGIYLAIGRVFVAFVGEFLSMSVCIPFYVHLNVHCASRVAARASVEARALETRADARQRSAATRVPVGDSRQRHVRTTQSRSSGCAA